MIIFFMVFIILSRGFLDIIFGLKLAYLIQFQALLIFFIIMRPNFVEFYKKYIAMVIFYFILGCISIFITFKENNNLIGVIYLFGNIFIFLIIYIEAHSRASIRLKNKIINSLIISSMLLVLFANLQILEVFKFPGESSIDGVMRPSSLTGSYLHYPLIIAVVSIISFQIYLVKKDIIYLMCSIILLPATFLSYSRSGPMIIIFGLLIYFSKNTKYLIGFLFLTAVFLFGFDNIYSDRVLSSVDINSLGNSGRITIWLDGVDIFYRSNWVFSNNSGFYSNITKNFSDTNYLVLESTLLQQLVNFGIINAIIYYWVIFQSYHKINKEYGLLRSLFLACVLETLIYQSGEVLPFIFVFGMLPLVSSYLDSWQSSKMIIESI